MAATLSGGGHPLNSKSPSQGFRSTNHQVPVVESQPTILERMILRPADLSEKVAEKVAERIKDAEEACAGDPVSGECVAAWDEVEELSAAVSHARDKKKESDPLEEYCKENPDTDDCRTYED